MKSLSYSNGFAARKTVNAVQARQSHKSYGSIVIEEENEFSSHGLFAFVQLLSRV